jgi:predicted enzyme related to lactoylglutathione lyase
MDEVHVDNSTYQMPPQDGGFTAAYFITVADIERSVEFYSKVFDGVVVSTGDAGGAPPFIRIANMWLILYVGGGPTPDKPTVVLRPPDPNEISSFINFRVADIQKYYQLWKSRGAAFLTEPIDKYGEIRCYIRDPDGYIIEVGESKHPYSKGS